MNSSERNNQNNNQKNDQFETASEIEIHLRRCHICDTVTENSNSIVDRCQGCNKALAPFVFCETTYKYQIKELSKNVFNNSKLKSIYPPLLGIALYW